MKKMISMVCVLAMLPVLWSVGGMATVSAEPEKGEVEDYYYNIYEGEAYIGGYRGTDQHVVIPETLGGCPVISITFESFYYNTDILSVVVPDTVLVIDGYAFVGCSSLESVTFSKNLQQISTDAFAGCSSLKELTFPDSLKVIGDEAFWGCTSLETVDFSNGTETIGRRAFYGCRSLKSVVIPASVQTVYQEAFSGCTSLASFAVEGAATSVYYTAIEDTPFYNNDDNWTDGMLYMGAILLRAKESETGEYVVREGTTMISPEAFYGVGDVKSVVIPDGVKSIGDWAFYGCEFLESIVIPSGVETIGLGAFECCHSLTYAVIPASVTSVGEQVFWSCDKLTDVFYGGTKKQWDALDVQYYTYAGELYVHFEVTENHWVMTELIKEPYCEQHGFASYECDCGYAVQRSVPETGHDSFAVDVVKPSCAAEGYTLYECRVCFEQYRDDVTQMRRTYTDNVCNACHRAVEECLASDHKYASNTDAWWVVHQPGATEITLTFSAQTALDDGYDILLICDGNERCVGEYTGTQLASQSVTVQGDTVKLRLISDDSMNYYGFAVTDVKATIPEPVADGDVNGDGKINITDAFKVYAAVSTGAVSDALFACADMNNDGKINITDAFAVYKIASGG